MTKDRQIGRYLILDMASHTVLGACVDGVCEGLLPKAPSASPMTKPKGVSEALEGIQAWLARTGFRMADVDGWVLGVGPGRLTGVRVAFSLVQALAYATDAPVWTVSHLDAWAQAAASKVRNVPSTWVHVWLDARLGQVYEALYQIESRNGGAVIQKKPLSERLVSPAQAAMEAAHTYRAQGISPQTVLAVGHGWALYAKEAQNLLAQVVHETDIDTIHTKHLWAAVTGQPTPLSDMMPTYLR